MILDKELEVVSAVAIQLGSVKPERAGSVYKGGPGEPIVCIATGVTADVVVTHGATNAAADPLTTVVCGGEDLVEFRLPSTTLTWVMFTFADGAVNIVLEGNQTNV